MDNISSLRLSNCSFSTFHNLAVSATEKTSSLCIRVKKDQYHPCYHYQYNLRFRKNDYIYSCRNGTSLKRIAKRVYCDFSLLWQTDKEFGCWIHVSNFDSQLLRHIIWAINVSWQYLLYRHSLSLLYAHERIWIQRVKD